MTSYRNAHMTMQDRRTQKTPVIQWPQSHVIKQYVRQDKEENSRAVFVCLDAADLDSRDGFSRGGHSGRVGFHHGGGTSVPDLFLIRCNDFIFLHKVRTEAWKALCIQPHQRWRQPGRENIKIRVLQIISFKQINRLHMQMLALFPLRT